MQIFRYFQFKNAETARSGYREKIDEITVARGKRKDLAMHRSGQEARIDARDIRSDGRFEATLGAKRRELFPTINAAGAGAQARVEIAQIASVHFSRGAVPVK